MIEMDYSKLKVGEKVYVGTEKTPYKVMARDERFIICNRPIRGKLDTDGQRRYWYFICDLERGVRGKDDLIFTIYDYRTKEGCEEALLALQQGKVKVTYRNCVPLDLKLGA
jgi:hypothetical protein